MPNSNRHIFSGVAAGEKASMTPLPTFKQVKLHAMFPYI